MTKIGSVQLGDRVRYKVNGFQGIATGISDYLMSCRQILISPEKLKDDGSRIEGVWVDEPWVEVIKAGVHKPQGTVVDSANKKVASGGPEREHPSR